jgi:hypothetical protein
MDLPTTQAYLGRSDRAQVARRIAAGAADTILYRDCDAIYVQRDPTWQPEPIVPSATHPSVAGFEDWAVTAHPEGFDDDVDNASDQVCSFTSGRSFQTERTASLLAGKRSTSHNRALPRHQPTTWPSLRRLSKDICWMLCGP